MKRSTANIVLVFADIFSLALLYFHVYQPLNEVLTAISNREAFIKYYSTLYILFGMALVPVAHIVGLIETYLPRYFNRSYFTKLVYGILILIVLSGFGTARWVKRTIIQNGYMHCESADVHRKLLQIKVYVLEDQTCRELILEKGRRRY